MVSILIPAYNAEKTIHRCLDSVLAQTYVHIEIIIVNDGSTDNTLTIIQGYAAIDSRIHVVNQENGGVAAARNTLISEMQGEYFLFLDADDWISPVMIENMLAQVGDADIIQCASDIAENENQIRQNSLGIKEVWDQAQMQHEFMLHLRMTGMLWNKLILSQTAKGCFFNEKTGYGEDAEFLWKVLKNAKKMVFTNDILYHHTLDDNSISHARFSDKKYSAIPMWEQINREVKLDYPWLMDLARERLASAAFYSLYECRCCGYNKEEQIRHMRSIARKNLLLFIKSNNISIKFKLYAIVASLGF